MFIRISYFWGFPAGLNQDEASIGYDAWADLTYGIDRNGDHNPVYSVSWGSGQFTLYKYLSYPWISLFGLNIFSVRATNVLFGCISLFSFWRISQLLFKSNSVIALFFFVINPWHIMMCRWGLESNLFPNLFLIALQLFLYAPARPFYFPISLFLFGLTFYAYGTAWITIPVILILSAAYLILNKKISLWVLFLSALVFIVSILPLGIFLLEDFFDLKPINLGFMTIPRFSVSRYESTVTILSEEFLQTGLNNLKTLFTLFWKQNDGLIWNSIPEFGTIYLFSTPFVLIGLLRFSQKAFCQKYCPEAFILFSVFSVLVLGFTSSLNINRANIMFIPIIFLMTEGILYVIHFVKFAVFPLFSVYLCAFLIFSNVYFTSYQQQIGFSFFEGLQEAIVFASDQTDGTVFLSETINAPYIHVLFHEQIHPEVFLDTVQYADINQEFRQVVSFDRYVTGFPEIKNNNQSAYILHMYEASYFDPSKFEMIPFDNYYVALSID